MISLSFDSTAKIASVAICDGEKLLALYNVDNGLTQSELLLPMAEDALRALKLGFDDIELLCASVGPGSFTGVRIGTALVKGIAFGRNIPCASVSTLEALAENLNGIDGIIVPAMDARRSQLYTAIFEHKDGSMNRLTEDLAISIKELKDRLTPYADKPIYIVGDGYEVAHKELTKLGVKLATTPMLLRAENAFSVARVGYKMHLEGKTVSDLEHMPTYLRIPQAERERLEKLNASDN